MDRNLPDPLCMTADELAHWREAAELVTINHGYLPGREDPCIDCTVAFASEMMGRGMCNGMPGMARSNRDRSDDPGWRARNRLDYYRRLLHDMGLDPAHAVRVA